ncbi:hypothetical protein IAD21_03376 [Abditibacteriota bacterium]|nr:hypothetical protein IAD21_03376 [Abditibacteriota bacterium]
MVFSSPVDVERFEREGFLAVEDVFTPAEVEEAKAELSALVEGLRDSKRVLRNSYGEVWRDETSSVMIQFERGENPLCSDDPDLELRVRKFHDFVGVAPHLTFLACSHPRMKAILDELVGQNAIMLQNMALVKPPGGIVKPPHQDNAYFKVAPLEAVVGVWIALDDAEVENGCMHFWPGRHRAALRHFHGSDCEIVHDRLHLEDAVPAPLRAGGALFFSGLSPHWTPANSSALRRRALQFHYRSADSRLVKDEEYDALFIEPDGTPASCSAASRRGF